MTTNPSVDVWKNQRTDAGPTPTNVASMSPTIRHANVHVGSVPRSVFPVRQAGLRSGGMDTMSDGIGPSESTQGESTQA